MDRAARLAQTFDLGSVHGPLVRAADGWGGHNQVFRLETSTGTWAIKRYGRPLDDVSESGFDVERAAWEGGVPMPRPIPTADGRCWAVLDDGSPYRCHEWIDGTARENEDTTPAEAGAMGRIVAHLHGLRLPADPPSTPAIDLAGRVEAALASGRARQAVWADTLVAHLSLVIAIADQPGPTDLGDDLVGSHQDLNAHNVLFSPSGLRLVDWDAAGPASPRWERADFAVRWAGRRDGEFDHTALAAFVRGYRDGGSQFDADDPDVLGSAPAALLPWVVQNLEMAVNRPTAEQDELADVMVAALVRTATRGDIAARQAALAKALATA